MAEQRTPTGIPGLDEIFHGGLTPQRSYLLAGGAGAGKTVFSVQWLLEGRCHVFRAGQNVFFRG